jgi:hypothetical protein
MILPILNIFMCDPLLAFIVSTAFDSDDGFAVDFG